MKQKNIIFYFSDQQRWDTVNEEVTPNLCQLAREGVKFENNFTCQPVCGPARACLQTGLYATQCGCCRFDCIRSGSVGIGSYAFPCKRCIITRGRMPCIYASAVS